MILVNHRRRLCLAFLAVAAVCVGGAFAAAPGSSAAKDGGGHTRTIKLREASPQPALTVVDVGAPGLSVGDHVVTTDGVVRPDGSAAGSLEQVCTVVGVGPGLFASTFDCTGSFRLDQGQITVQGAFVPADAESSFAVTGGTGSFSAARGEVILATEADQITIALD